MVGVVLSGGRSLRFGEDKRFFKINGKTLLEIALEKIEMFNVRVLSIGKFDKLGNDELLEKGIKDVRIIRDEIPYIGPMGGIYSVLKSVDVGDGGVFIPVDMPFLKECYIRTLLENVKGLVVCFRVNGRIFPLPAYYSKFLLEKIENFIKLGEYSLYRLIESEENKFFIEIEGDKSFLNLNSFVDLL